LNINDNWFTIIFDRPTERWYERWSEKGLTERETEIIIEVKIEDGVGSSHNT